MKLKTFLLCLSIFCFSNLYSSDFDELMWECAYHGNYELTHRLALVREIHDLNDELLNQFVMAYVLWSLNDQEGVKQIVEGVDSFLEYQFIISPRLQYD